MTSRIVSVPVESAACATSGACRASAMARRKTAITPDPGARTATAHHWTRQARPAEVDAALIGFLRGLPG